ncbi:hypothetical protein GCM10018771_15800 [Streptomyces cellulosae]|nr:hypothetical protein GCM10018771_15800 [Streptomyces cellulosae]
MSKPSPTQDPWLLELPDRPSTDPEEYEIPTLGSNPPGTSGTFIAYDHEKSPVLRLVLHCADDDNGVAL